jgi:predicted TIM-barrel fold metal-dependent hydrolase
MKLTSLVLRQAEAEPGGPEAWLTALCERFGADRLMWGSDYSQTHDRSYTDLVALARRAAAPLSADDRDRFLAGTALAMWPQLASGR